MAKVLLEGVDIMFRNFTGKAGEFNQEGDRNFAVILPGDVVDKLVDDGWNVRFRDPREEGDEPIAYLSIKVSYRNRPPKVAMITERGRTMLDEGTVSLLDWVDIQTVDMFINPYRWEKAGKTGISAYLDSIYVTINEDVLEKKYNTLPVDSAVPTRTDEVDEDDE